MSSIYDKKSLPELKEILKKLGLVCSGDKYTLIYRLKLYDKCKTENLLSENNENLCVLKLSELKKLAMKYQLSIIGTQDEILNSVVEYCSKNNTNINNTNINNNNNNNNNNNKENIGVIVAKKIIELDELEDDLGILNVLNILNINNNNNIITKNSSIELMRKNYLKISLLIHPDKIGNIYNNATKSFQILVKSFEHLTTENLNDNNDNNNNFDNNNSNKKKDNNNNKVFNLMRSNENCYRTRILCPKCNNIWNETSIEGNPQYYYTLLMLGLKRYCCSVCLCEFGCVTAKILCPYCEKCIEYSPLDYHRQISCLHCNKLFGFYIYHISDRIINELKKELKEDIEKRKKSRDNKLRRAIRADQYNNNSINFITKSNIKNENEKNENENLLNNNNNNNNSEEEKSFLCGLRDTCPRCGNYLEGSKRELDSWYKTDRISLQQLHLNECNDKNLHNKYQLQLKKQNDKKNKKLLKEEEQDDVQALATWSYLGSKTNDMWLLTDNQIKKKAIDMGLLLTDQDNNNNNKNNNNKINRLELLQKIHNKTNNTLLLNNNNNNNNSMENETKNMLVIKENNNNNNNNLHIKLKKDFLDSLPKNIHTLTKDELLSFCVANGLIQDMNENKLNKLLKKDLITIIEHQIDNIQSNNKHNIQIIDLDESISNNDNESEYSSSNDDNSDIEIIESKINEKRIITNNKHIKNKKIKN